MASCLNNPRSVLSQLLIALILLAISPLSLAQDRSCSEFLKELELWPEGGDAYQIMVRKAMDPRIREKLDKVKNKRSVTRTKAKKIDALYYHVFVQECKNNPGVSTYYTSTVTESKTRKLVEDLMR